MGLTFAARTDTPRAIAAILESEVTALLGRFLLTLAFWESLYEKLTDFSGGLAQMAHFNLAPPFVFLIATILVQAIGVILVMTGRYTWLGAGMLGVFSALCIPIAMPFWKGGPDATLQMQQALHHIGEIGGLIICAIWTYERNKSRR